MTNRYRPHVIVLPEDRRTRQIANGFVNVLAIDDRRIQVMPESGGWLKVIGQFTNEYISSLGNYPDRHLIMVVDFDNQLARTDEVHTLIPEELRDRVFLIGILSESERLRSELQLSFEQIGAELAKDCVNEETTTWNTPLLKHNASELSKLMAVVRPFIVKGS